MPKEIQPRAAIDAWIASTGKTMLRLAVESGVSLNTLYRHRADNTWPAQARTREGLRRALGLAHGAQSTDSNGQQVGQ